MNKSPLLKELVGYDNNDDGIFFMEENGQFVKTHKKEKENS